MFSKQFSIIALLYLFSLFTFGLCVNCPDAAKIFPCTCTTGSDSIGIRVDMFCEGEVYMNISKIFQQIGTPIDPYWMVFIRNKAFDEVPENVFHMTTFRGHIAFHGCDNLRKFNKNAFATTSVVTPSISIRDNKRLNDLSLFTALNQVSAAETIEIMNNNLPAIPDKAFSNNQDNLWQLHILESNLKKLGQRAFEGLTSLKELTIESTNIDFIPDFAFEFKNSSSTTIIINLGDNPKISSTSFGVKAFANIGRPTVINFDNNNINYLNETVFMPFLKNNTDNRINMNRNEVFDCNDCKNSWLNKNSMNSKIILQKCSNGNELDNPKNFLKC